MTAPGEFQFAFTGDQTTFADAAWEYAHPDSARHYKVVSSELKPKNSGEARMSLVAAPDYTQDIISRVEFSATATSAMFHDNGGPALVVPPGEINAGCGYRVNVNGDIVSIMRMDNYWEKGTALDSVSGIAFAGTDVVGLKAVIEGASRRLTVIKNGVAINGVNAVVTDYITEVHHGVASTVENVNARAILTFGADGMASTVVSPEISGVNGNDVIVSGEAIEVFVTNPTLVTAITVEQSGKADVTLTLNTVGPASIACDAVDFTETEIDVTQPVTVRVTDGTTPDTLAADVEFSDMGNVTLLIVSDTGLGSISASTAIDDIIHWPLTVAGGEFGMDGVTGAGDFIINPAAPNGERIPLFRYDGTTYEEMAAIINLVGGPDWSLIAPAFSTEGQSVEYDISPYATPTGGSLSDWALVAWPSGFSISSDGVITTDGTPAPGGYGISVSVKDDYGTSTSSQFTWTVTAALRPQWQNLPNVTSQSGAPKSFDVSGYVTGAIGNWALVNGYPGFSIDQDGVITCDGTSAVYSYVIEVGVENEAGTSISPEMTWAVSGTNAPSWTSIPDKSYLEGSAYAYSVFPYVSSIAGVLRNWAIDATDPGITIDQSGIVQFDDTVPSGNYSLRVSVSNDYGPSSSGPFSVTMTALPKPTWVNIPATSTPDGVEGTYDISGYATSSAGDLDTWTLVSGPAAFSVDASGVVTCADTALAGYYGISVSVADDNGTTTSPVFTWLVGEVATSSENERIFTPIFESIIGDRR